MHWHDTEVVFQEHCVMLVLRVWNLTDRQNIERVVICLFVAEILAVTHELHLDDITEEILHDGHILML